MDNFIENNDLFIFDLNNAIVDVEIYHYKAWLITLQNILGKNFSFSYNFFCEKFHPKDYDSIKNYLENKLNLYNYDELMINKNKIYLELLKNNNIKLIEGFYEFFNKLINNNKKIIIISDTYKDNIDFFINYFPFLNKITKFYYRELFNHKFDNDTYLKIINQYPNEKIIYITYYIITIDIFYNYNDKIKIIYLNNDGNDIYRYYIKENYPNIKIIKNYLELNNLLIKNKIINTIRLLCMSVINKANSGHPGIALGCAPFIFILFTEILNYDNNNPLWIDRDRFILSSGHGSALLYVILHLSGYTISIDDLKKFRQINSLTSGHPEYNPELGIEITTGPLGQGIANGVGMAIASKKLNIKNKIFVLCGDGCLMEGISYEACSLAGHLNLNNLILIYDDNKITLDGSTNLTFTENVQKRFKSQKWNVLEIKDGNNDLNDIYEKLNMARLSKDKPTIIFLKTIIGYGSNKSGNHSIHGLPLGDKYTNELMKNLDFENYKTFNIDEDVKTYFLNLPIKKKIKLTNNLKEFNNNNNYIFHRLSELNQLKNKNYSTRDISSFCLNILVNNMDNIIIGSADTSESNKTIIESDFIKAGNFNGKYLHYGVREHAMIAIANGISTYNIIPIVGTFLIFSNYCLAAIRMSAFSNHKILFIFTHDSVFLGEDGPTHQPIESLTILRSIPNLIVYRPCDINETSAGYQLFLKLNKPFALILSRQVLPYIETSNQEKSMLGAYTIFENNLINNNNDLDLIIISSGSEINLSIEVSKFFLNYNIRVISMTSTYLYDNQSQEYKDNLIPKKVKKMSIEAGSTMGWYKYVDYAYGIDEYGKSANLNDLYSYFKFTKNDIINYINENIFIDNKISKKQKL